MKDNPNTFPNLKPDTKTNSFTRISKWFNTTNSKVWANRKKILRAIALALKIISKAMAGAVVFAFMAELAPGLRENLPNFYKLVDFLLAGLEFLAKKVVEGVNF